MSTLNCDYIHENLTEGLLFIQVLEIYLSAHLKEITAKKGL